MVDKKFIIHQDKTLLEALKQINALQEGPLVLFAVDEEGRLSDILNPSSVLPQTIVMDGDGNVVYNSTGSLEYEELSNIVSGAVKR